MIPGEFDFDQSARAGNPAAYVAGLDDDALRTLCRHTEGIMRDNDTKGGYPAILKWCCVLEAAKRFLTSKNAL